MAPTGERKKREPDIEKRLRVHLLALLLDGPYGGGEKKKEKKETSHTPGALPSGGCPGNPICGLSARFAVLY